MGGHTEPRDGGLSIQAAYCLTHCSILLFSPIQIPYTTAQHTQAQQWPWTPPLSRCQPPTQLLSMVQQQAWQGMQTPWRGLAAHPLSEGTVVLDLAAWLFNDCISILWHLTGTLSGPTFVPLQYQNVSVSCPQPGPLLSLLTWWGKVRWEICYCSLLPDPQVSVFFNGLGGSLLLMYNLLLILLTLKGEHVDRDLTYEGLVGFDVINTKSRDFFFFFSMVSCWFCLVILI